MNLSMVSIIIYYLLINILFYNVNSTFTSTITLVDDTYSQNSYCSPTHFITVTSTDMGLDTFYFEDFQGTQSSNQNIYGLTSSVDGSTNYYSFYITSNFFIGNTATKLRAKDTTYHNFQLINDTINYVCELIPEQLVIPNIIKLNKPIKPELYFKVYVSNLHKRITSSSATNQLESNPFYLNYISSEPYYIYFKLYLFYTSSTPPFNQLSTNPILRYNVTLDSARILTIYLESPIKSIDSSSFEFINQYPSAISYNTFSNWDINNLVFINGTNINLSDLFFFNVITGLPTSFDKNQYYGLIAGNPSSGQYLSLSSYFPNYRDTSPQTSSTTNLYLYYNTATSISSFLVSNSPIGISLVTPSYTQQISDGFRIITYEFKAAYPDNYKLSIKISECNFFIPTYPYGITSIESGIAQFTISLITNEYIKPSIIVATDVMEPSTVTGPTNNLDINPPVLLDFQLYYPKRGDGNYAILTIQVQDVGSGFSYLYYGGNYITIADLVSGTKNDGIYEKLIYVTFDTTCQLSDKANNIVQCSLSNPNIDYYYSPNPLKSVPKLVDYDFEITTFYFEESIYDLSDSGKLVTVYLNFSTSNYDTPISFMLLDRIYGDKNININSTSYRYLMDPKLNLFKITFYLPPKLCTGSIPYLLIIYGKQFTSDYFTSRFGTTNNTLLNVISNDCYELPPRVTELKYLNSNVPVDLNSIQTTKVGWSFKVESGSNIKISYVYFHVVSDYDKLGYPFTFKPDSNSFNGILEIDVDSTSTRSQTFRIYNVTIIDERGIRSDHIDTYTADQVMQYSQLPKYASSISPLYQIEKQLLNLQLIASTTFTPENIPPTILFDDLTYKQNDLLDSVIDLQFITIDNDEISTRHIPQVYLESFTNYGDLQIIPCNTSFNSCSSVSNCTYDAQCIATYGFGFENGVSISIYGAVDKSLNIAGTTTISLLNFSSIFNTTKPLISKWTPLLAYSNRLTIFGKNLPRSGGYAYIYYLDGDSDNQIALNYKYQSSVYAELEIPISNKPFVIYILNSINQESNKIEIHYLNSGSSSSSSSTSSTSSSSEELPIECLDNCGGSIRGTCIENIGCRCNSPYSGLNCMSQSIKVPQPQTNITSPDSTNEFPVSGTDIKLNTIISFVAVRELNYLGDQVNIHYFDVWNFTTITSSQFKYTSKIFKNNQHVSNITVDMEWYEDSTIIQFAGQNITLNPSSLKYYITLDAYPFETTLNTFELIIKSAFKSSQTNNVCSSKEFALNDGNNYISMVIGKYTFEGKFIKKGLLNDDKKTITIGNKLLDNFNNTNDPSTSNQQVSFISIQLPQFNKILLDPSFSVLINPNESNKNSANSICSNNKFGLTPAQISGIVVGGVVFIVLISLILLHKFSNSSRFRIIFYKLFKKNIKL